MRAALRLITSRREIRPAQWNRIATRSEKRPGFVTFFLLHLASLSYFLLKKKLAGWTNFPATHSFADIKMERVIRLVAANRMILSAFTGIWMMGIAELTRSSTRSSTRSDTRSSRRSSTPSSSWSLLRLADSYRITRASMSLTALTDKSVESGPCTRLNFRAIEF